MTIELNGRLGALGFSFALALISSPSWAVDTFPPLIKAHLALESAPDCSLCHNGPASAATFGTKFGLAARSRGMVVRDNASLERALDAMEGEKIDSDGDGVSDVAELRANSDPNVAAGGSAVPKLETGCAINASRAWSSREVFAAALVFGLMSLMRRPARRA